MYKLLIKIILLISTTTLPLSSTAQQLGLDILEDKKQIDIPFKYHQGFLILDVRFQNILPLQLIYDTGAEHSILFKKELIQLLGIPLDKSISILGSDRSQEMIAYVVRNIYLQAGNTGNVLRDIVVLEDDILHFEEITGEKIDGILGASFFRGLIVRINYKKSKMTLINPKHFEEPSEKKYDKIPIEIYNYKPYIKAQISTDDHQTTPTRLLLDTGAALGFLFHANTQNDVKLPNTLVTGSLGKGLGGELMGFLGKTNKLEIGKYQFSQLLTYYQDLDSLYQVNSLAHRNGLIGNDILSRFDIYFDYMQGYVYMRAHKRFNKEIPYDKSGLIVYAVGQNLNKYYVKNVIEGSAADLAGIKSGDFITKIGWRRTKYVSLSHILNKLSKKHGKKIKLQILRNQETLKKEFRLVDPFLEH